MIVNETKIKVRYAETDQMGIVHHSNYLVWFEAGRTELIIELGMRYTDMEKAGVFLPLIESGSKYKAPARYEDNLIIKSFTEELDAVRIKFGYEIYNEEDSKLIATGFTVHAFVNEQMKPFNLKKIKPDIWQFMKKGLE